MKGFKITIIGWYIILMGFVIFSLFMLCGCRSVKYIEVEKIKTDTTYINRQQRDSIWLHDSIYTHEYVKGDTCYVEISKWKTKYIERLLTDTIYKATHDTIPRPYPVPIQLTRLERLKIDFGGYAMVFSFIVIVLLIVLIVIKVRQRLIP